MRKLFTILALVFLSVTPSLAGTAKQKSLRDLYFGEALYFSYQGEWFDAISRLDTEVKQHYGVDEPEKDTLHYHIGEATFDVGDFELYYRMHQKAGRAIKLVIEGNVDDETRNEAIYRLAKIYFQKDQPEMAQEVIKKIHGKVQENIRPEVSYLKANIDMANGDNEGAVKILKNIEGDKNLEGFATYNLGIALIRNGKQDLGYEYLDKAGSIVSTDLTTLSIKDKANLVLGEKLLAEKKYDRAKEELDRVQITGPFSNRSLLSSGWADAAKGQYENALVPWTILSRRSVTDSSVEEAMLALPYAYGKLGVYSKSAVLYGDALQSFGKEIDRLDKSITSIKEGKFLPALTREEVKNDPTWVVDLRKIPETPETYYLLDLMASNDFQESLKNYLDLEGLRKKMTGWTDTLAAFEDMIAIRKAYYQPILPVIDKKFRELDSLMRLRLEQRDRIDKKLKKMLTSPHPEYLATMDERIAREKLNQIEKKLSTGGKTISAETKARITRLRGLLKFSMYTEYDKRFTDAHKHLKDLNREIDKLKAKYTEFVRIRQAVTQSYEGYSELIDRMRTRITTARQTVNELMTKQGHMLEIMAINELTIRRERLEDYQIKASFGMADSYDRAMKTKQETKGE
jgi:lipopolysaccharide biosynthesis regulator YciM